MGFKLIPKSGTIATRAWYQTQQKHRLAFVRKGIWNLKCYVSPAKVRLENECVVVDKFGISATKPAKTFETTEVGSTASKIL